MCIVWPCSAQILPTQGLDTYGLVTPGCWQQLANAGNVFVGVRLFTMDGAIDMLGAQSIFNAVSPVGTTPGGCAATAV
jgi:hypothetical protein